MNYYDKNGSSYLQHYGVLGQKWGIRRYQNLNGTLTEEGKKRYLVSYRVGEAPSGDLNKAIRDHYKSQSKIYKLDFETPRREASRQINKLLNNPSIQSWKRGGKELRDEY